MNIFVTVGTQLPFDRLISAVDAWAANRDCEVFAQMGASPLRPRNIACKDFISTSEAGERIKKADLVVAHAGMGTILTRLEAGLPMLVMPRRASLGEHRNDHQTATSRRLSHLPGLWVVESEEELCEWMGSFKPAGSRAGMEAVASASLIAAIRDFVSL